VLTARWLNQRRRGSRRLNRLVPLLLAPLSLALSLLLVLGSTVMGLVNAVLGFVR